MSFLTLDMSDIGRKYVVVKIRLDHERAARLSHIGLTVGTEIRKLFISPFGDPSAYEFKGSIFAVCQIDAGKILVQEISSSCRTGRHCQ